MEGEEGLLKDARRLLAVNAGEQKRLEKLQRHIEKKKREKERILARAQKDAIEKFYENSREFLDKSRNTSVKASSDIISKGHEICVENITVRNAKGTDIERHYVPRKKLSLQESSSKSFLPGLDLTLYGLKAQRFNRARTRSWSDSSLEDFSHTERKDRGESILKEEEEEQKQKLFIHEDAFGEDLEEKPEKPLSAILPPLVLPPLHQQRRRSLQEHNKNFCRTGNTTLSSEKSLKEQYEELSECRYLRVYQRKDILKGFHN